MTCVVIPADSHPYVCTSCVTPELISDLIGGISGGLIPARVPEMMFFAPENQEDAEHQTNTLASIFASVVSGGSHHLAGTIVIAGNHMNELTGLLASVGSGQLECLSEDEATALMDTLTETRLALHGGPLTMASGVKDQEEFRQNVRHVADKVLREPRQPLLPLKYTAIPDPSLN